MQNIQIRLRSQVINGITNSYRIMKTLLATIVVILAPLVMCYDESYDKIDVDKILADDALFDGYLNCMLDKGPCTMDNAVDFRKILPEIVATKCAKCSPIQKKNLRKTLKAMTERRPEMYKELVAKYDPKHEHEKDFADFALETD